jgi:hypothetical protein
MITTFPVSDLHLALSLEAPEGVFTCKVTIVAPGSTVFYKTSDTSVLRLKIDYDSERWGTLVGGRFELSQEVLGPLLMLFQTGQVREEDGGNGWTAVQF